MNLSQPGGSTLTAERLHVTVAEDRPALGRTAAQDAGDCIRRLLQSKPEINIIFASAPSQNEFLEELKKQPGISWDRINAFHMDEYIGLPDHAPQNFGVFLEERLFNDVPVRNFYRLNGNAPDVAAEIARYKALLELYPVDIVCMGIGENCHIAFNDPHVADFNDPEAVKVVELDLISREQQVHDGCFETLDQVPEKALTLTIPTLVKPPHIFCMVPGTHKAQAVRHTLLEPAGETYPSTILRSHADARLYVDHDSASLL